MNYEEIKDRLLNVEVICKVKDYSKNKVMIDNYYEIGRLIFEEQGGESRAKYGNKLIKEYSKKLSDDLGKKYSWRNLYNMRTFYQIFSKNENLQALPAKLTWTHYLEVLHLKNIDKIKYYILLAIKENLTYRELHNRIKNDEYERLEDDTKLKLIDNQETTLTEEVKNPIIIPNPKNKEIISEKLLHNLILENWEQFLEELGTGYSLMKSEYPIKIGSRYNYIDLLLFNVDFNSYVVIELKIGELKKEYIGQIDVYMNYIDKEKKKDFHNKTIGIILCKKDNKLVMEYCSNPNIITREYILN